MVDVQMFLRAGVLVVFSTGEYSDYSYNGMFLAMRDLTREDLRAIITAGLEQTRGNYKALVQSFNLGQSDYKRFLNFLRKYQCHMPFQRFRSARIRVDEQGRDEQMTRSVVSA